MVSFQPHLCISFFLFSHPFDINFININSSNSACFKFLPQRFKKRRTSFSKKESKSKNFHEHPPYLSSRRSLQSLHLSPILRSIPTIISKKRRKREKEKKIKILSSLPRGKFSKRSSKRSARLKGRPLRKGSETIFPIRTIGVNDRRGGSGEASRFLFPYSRLSPCRTRRGER